MDGTMHHRVKICLFWQTHPRIVLDIRYPCQRPNHPLIRPHLPQPFRRLLLLPLPEPAPSLPALSLQLNALVQSPASPSAALPPLRIDTRLALILTPALALALALALSPTIAAAWVGVRNDVQPPNAHLWLLDKP